MMKRILFFGTLLMTAILLTSCSVDQPAAPEQSSQEILQGIDRAQTAAEVLNLATWPIEETEGLPDADPEKCMNLIVGYEREVVTGQIVHYRWDIQVSMDERDVVTLHRVVKERRPYRPIRTRKAIFLLHGDVKNFQGMFLPSTYSANTPPEFGAAVYWASRGVDVWGLDQAWNNVPAETEDHSFMADWGIDKQATDLGNGIAVARLARRATGNGYDKMILLGYSSGSVTGYALINAETQLPRGHRQVGGWIPVDYSPVSDIQEWNDVQNCDWISEYQGMMDNGEYGYAFGFDYMGIMARDYPDDPSPVFDGFTNLEALIYMGAGPIFGYAQMHYLAGVWEDEMPVDLVYTTVGQWIDFASAGTPWEPTKFILDYATWGCGETDVPWDDYFGEITVPVLNVAATGGIGPTTHYCLSLLGSSDITDMDVGFLPPDESLYDFGHIDIFIGDVAPDLVWQPVLEWVEDHSHTNNGHHGGHGNNH